MMKIFLVSILMVFRLVSSIPSDKLFLTVYYESLCPDSRAFIVDQLLPTVHNLQDYLTVQMVPFGKARSKANGLGGFQCQHGPSECWGNMMQDCSLNLMKDRTYIDKVAYVACEMNKAPRTKGSACAENFNVPLNLLKDCVTSYTGIALQLEAERLTNQVKPRFVPTVTVNGVFNQEIQDRTQVDLMGTLCDILQNVPQSCHNHNALRDAFT